MRDLNFPQHIQFIWNNTTSIQMMGYGNIADDEGHIGLHKHLQHNSQMSPRYVYMKSCQYSIFALRHLSHFVRHLSYEVGGADVASVF